jgi:hypothetical protein
MRNRALAKASPAVSDARLMGTPWQARKRRGWGLVSVLGASTFVCATASAQAPPAVATTAPAPVGPRAAAPAASPGPMAPGTNAPAATPPTTDATATEDAGPDEAAAEQGREGKTVDVHLRTNQPGVAFHYAKVARPDGTFEPVDWTRVCLGECAAHLKPGYYRFALSYGAGAPVLAPTVFEPRKGGRFEGAYTDRSNRRLTGALILGLGGLSSLASITTGAVLASKEWSSQADVGGATIAGGCVGLLISLLVGIPLAASSDETSVTPVSRSR